jgi:hypothetical protein
MGSARPGRGLVANVIRHDDRAGELAADVDLDRVALLQVTVQKRQPDGAHAFSSVCVESMPVPALSQ